MKKLFILTLAVAMCYCVDAQIKTPSASTSAKVMQTVGLTDVTVEYSRPSMKGRTIFAADGLVPYGKMWRTGANQATKITFSDDVMVGASKLPAGSYAITTVPTAATWVVNFYTHESTSWSSYKEKTPVAAVKASPMTSNSSVETYRISFENITDTSADLVMAWANTHVPVKISVDVDDRVMKNIEQVLAGPTPNDYYNAATYYHTSGKDKMKALELVRKATQVDKPKFWQVRREALILADMGKFAEAIKTADKSMQLAKAAGNDDYVKMNQESINAWAMKK